LKVYGSEEEWNFEAMSPSPTQLGLVFIPPPRDFRVRDRIWNTTRNVDFVCQEKGIEAAHKNR